MTVQHPIITYRLTPTEQNPCYLCKKEGSFFPRLYPINTNPNNKLSIWNGCQVDKFVGLGCGPIDPEGIPTEVTVLSTKTQLQSHVTEATTGWTVDSRGVTGIRTETTSGTDDAWNASTVTNDIGVGYTGPGLTTTTTAPVSFDTPAGTVILHNENYTTRIVVETQNSSGVTTSIEEFTPTYQYNNITIVSVSTAVGIVTTTGPDEHNVTTTITSTTTTSATHEDVVENYGDSFTTVDVDGEVTKTRVRTFTETTKVRNPFDPVAATNELWAQYEAINHL
jgi:hypothetical protein